MTRWGALLGLLAGVAELSVRGQTPGGWALYAMVLGADCWVGAAIGWVLERLPRARVGWPLAALGLFVVGAQSDEARQGVLAMPSPAKVGLRAAWALSDPDLDGYGAWLGQRDCAPFDGQVHPGAAELPGNGIDDNCLGGDLAEAWPLPAPGPPAAARVRGVLLVTLDSVRADHMSCYGYERPTTPHIDALAARGTRFLRAYSHTPATRWSLPMLHTSRWPSEIPWDRNIWPRAVPDEVQTLAERLAERGVRTGASWPLDVAWGLEQGFDRFDRPTSGRFHYAPPVVGAARRFVRSLADEPWFFWLHLFDPHLPYAPRDAQFGDGAVDRYDAELAAADAALGRLLGELPADTAVIVTADHGEEFGDHGGYAHRDRLYEELIRVPLIVKMPQKNQATAASAAGLLDVAPTVADLLGAPVFGRGRSLLPDVTGARSEPDRPVFASLAFYPDDPSQGRAVVRGNDKLLFSPVSLRSESYDLSADPHERHPLPGDSAGLMELLIPFIERTSAR